MDSLEQTLSSDVRQAFLRSVNPSLRGLEAPALAAIRMPRTATLRVGMIGNYPPRRCGIASYTMDMAAAMQLAGADVSVCAMDDGTEDFPYPDIVNRVVPQHDGLAYLEMATSLNASVDAVVVQHEYGIYGGDAGEDILITLRNLRVPIVSVLHTILEEPSPVQRRILREIADLSSHVVVMSETAQAILDRVYHVPFAKTQFVPHGVPESVTESRAESKAQYGWENRRVILTFGLLSPGKGIEYVLNAITSVVKEHPDVLYVLAGQTHPHVRRLSGEKYRENLLQMADSLGVSEHIEFVDRYLDLPDLCQLLNACDVYVTPYLNAQQITSGTLSYAVGAGRPVISTVYIHANELLGDGTGILVPFRDADAIATALARVLDDPREKQEFERRALAKGDEMRWSKVGEQMMRIALTAQAPQIPALRAVSREITPPDTAYLTQLVDDTGVLQHATYDVPLRNEGYCSDDNARVLTLVQTLLRQHGPDIERQRIEAVALSFLGHAWNPDQGRFRNFMDFARGWVESVGSEESQARSFAALAGSSRWASTEGRRTYSLQLSRQAQNHFGSICHVRSMANILTGLADLIYQDEADSAAIAIGSGIIVDLRQRLEANAEPGWNWIEQELKYDNGKIPEGILQYAMAVDDPDIGLLGIRLLRWLDEVHTGPMGLFMPVGADGFWPANGKRAVFDQQPIEACSMILAYQAAYKFDRDPAWLLAAERAFNWFWGNNISRVPMADARGAYDGLASRGPNLNRGAESTWAYLSANAAYRSMRESWSGISSMNHRPKDWLPRR